MTTLPSVAPGDPICHLAYTKKGALQKAEITDAASEDQSLYQRVRDELASCVLVKETGSRRTES